MKKLIMIVLCMISVSACDKKEVSVEDALLGLNAACKDHGGMRGAMVKDSQYIIGCNDGNLVTNIEELKNLKK